MEALFFSGDSQFNKKGGMILHTKNNCPWGFFGVFMIDSVFMVYRKKSLVCFKIINNNTF